jgi:hypothetical protein
MTRFFDKAPIGDPHDPKGQKLLTVEVDTNAKPVDGILRALVSDVNGLDWIDISFPLTGLTLAGMPSDFLDADDPGDPEIMLELLDRACMYVDDWRKRRAVILPKPAPVETAPETAGEPGLALGAGGPEEKAPRARAGK